MGRRKGEIAFIYITQTSKIHIATGLKTVREQIFWKTGNIRVFHPYYFRLNAKEIYRK